MCAAIFGLSRRSSRSIIPQIIMSRSHCCSVSSSVLTCAARARERPFSLPPPGSPLAFLLCLACARLFHFSDPEPAQCDMHPHPRRSLCAPSERRACVRACAYEQNVASAVLCAVFLFSRFASLLSLPLIALSSFFAFYCSVRRIFRRFSFSQCFWSDTHILYWRLFGNEYHKAFLVDFKPFTVLYV